MKVFLSVALCVTSLCEVEGTQVRVATYNTSLALTSRGQLAAQLRATTHSKARQVAEIIQIIAPDIILLNEFDYDAGSTALTRFHNNYLSVSQGGQTALDYPYRYTAPSNTGIHSGFDLDNNNQIDSSPGDINYGGDAFGFGEFEGKYGMAILSKYPIDTAAIRTFQLLKWQSMPGNLIPQSFYSEVEKAELRLSSKSHWDIPVLVDGQRIHLLCSHPTPPVFDGTEDRNGRRNHDEIRLWADFLSDHNDYLIDDLGQSGGLADGERFILLGDQNADPTRGDSFNTAIDQWLDHPKINASFTPERSGTSSALSRFDTATFSLRVDYVLPSKTGLEILDGAVFWPSSGQTGANRLAASDHRPVYLDLKIVPSFEEAVRDLDISVNDDTAAISWRALDGISYALETSHDLTNWSPLNVAVSLDDGICSASFPVTKARRFLRVSFSP